MSEKGSNENRVANEERERERVTWGEGNPTMENHSADLNCKNPECNYCLPITKWYKHVVGVKEAPFAGPCNEYLAQIIECPNCFEKYWFHISNTAAEIYKKRKEREKQK